MTAEHNPAGDLPPALQKRLRKLLATMPSVQVASVRPGEGGRWIVELTADGETAAIIVLAPSDDAGKAP